jgi:flagellar motor protein MotB
MAKKNKKNLSKQPENSKSGWETVYSGFILIMLCFFVMLSSFATMQEFKVMRGKEF